MLLGLLFEPSDQVRDALAGAFIWQRPTERHIGRPRHRERRVNEGGKTVEYNPTYMVGGR